MAASRRIEDLAQRPLAAHTLMQRAGLALAKLALALVPHSRLIWVACGPGNNGGDGMEAAMHLKRWGKHPVVTWLGSSAKAPPDAWASYTRAQEAGVVFADEPPSNFDLVIDALLGIGARPCAPMPQSQMANWIDRMNDCSVPVLAVDLPTGLNADTGVASCVTATHTLCLLTLKPGLFTAQGRDAAGTIWFDDLGTGQALEAPDAWLAGMPTASTRLHATHKGCYGDVAVVGGAPGMTGAALLAASAALHGGAGRVFVCLHEGGSLTVNTTQPELMFRASLATDAMTVVCGCGGGPLIAQHLPRLLASPSPLVLDADALNAIAADVALQALSCTRSAPTVLTPHPLEAARLLACSTTDVQANRLTSAQDIARRYGGIVVLKGSGTVIAQTGKTSVINPTGNAKLATAGTGDVLAGMIGAQLASGCDAFEAACHAVYQHGQMADQWPDHQALSASMLANLSGMR